MNKGQNFESNLQELAAFAKVISHPARLAILQYLAETKSCISGDISDFIPLSRTTVSQHLKELREAGLIKGETEGLKINYCLRKKGIKKFNRLLSEFMETLQKADVAC